MKQKVRFNFETNSSSTHSLTILSEEDFNKFEKGEIFIDWNGKVLSKEEAEAKLFDGYSYESYLNDYVTDFGYDSVEEYKEYEHENDEQLRDRVISFAIHEDGTVYDYYNLLGEGQEYYETYEKHYTTKSGDKIVAFGCYGEDR